MTWTVWLVRVLVGAAVGAVVYWETTPSRLRSSGSGARRHRRWRLPAAAAAAAAAKMMIFVDWQASLALASG